MESITIKFGKMLIMYIFIIDRSVQIKQDVLVRWKQISVLVIIKIVSSMIITQRIYTFDFQTGSVPMFYDCNRQSPSQ